MGKIARISGIYIIINKNNNYVYIGSSLNIHERWKSHRYALKANRHRNKFLQRAYNKHGLQSFTFSVIEQIQGSRIKLFSREQYWIDCYIKLGYTLYNGHKKVIMSNVTEAQRELLNSQLKGKTPWNKGKQISDSLCYTIDSESLYKDYMSGIHVKDLIIKYNYNREGIRQLLNQYEQDHNLPRRKLESKRKILHLNERQVNYIIKLHLDGNKLEDIANLFETNRATLSREVCRIKGVKNINEIRKNCKDIPDGDN